MNRRALAVIRAASVAAVLTVVAAACVFSPAVGTKGTMPPPGPNGEIDSSAVPDYVAVAGPVGIAGYVTKEAVLVPGDRTWPVYGNDLRTLVGYMVPGRGFVAVGVDPQSVPTFEVVVAPASEPGPPTGRVTVYVRNDASEDVWMAIDGQAIGSIGFNPHQSGVGCIAMALGSSLVYMDRSPADAGAQPVAVLYVRGEESTPTPIWVIVDGDRQLHRGTGVPPWWGEAQAC